MRSTTIDEHEERINMSEPTTTTPSTTAPGTTAPTGERADLLAMLERHRSFLVQTVQGLSDDQARATPTVSALCLGGLIKHVTATQDSWLDFIEHGAPTAADAPEIDWENPDPALLEHFSNGFRLLEQETLSGVLDEYAVVAERTAEITRTADLDLSQPLPDAPWFEPGATWTVRRVLMHLVAETAQHAGHADIIRESIDGQRTMG